MAGRTCLLTIKELKIPVAVANNLSDLWVPKNTLMRGARWSLPFLYSVEVCLRILRVGDTIRISRKGGESPLCAPLLVQRHTINTNGYLNHLELGTDPETGKRNLLVKSANEYFQLPEDQQRRAWAVVKVAAGILERPAMTLYQHIYKGKIVPKVIKKNTFDRHGLTLIKPYGTIEDGQTRRKEDQMRITRTLKKSLNRTPWLRPAQRELLVAIVYIRIGEFEREILKNETSKGIEGGIEREQEVIA